MKELVTVLRNDAVVSSLQVAEHFGKRHDRLIQTIEEQYGDLHEFVEMFRQATYPDNYGRKQKIYYMNRDGFSLLVMGFTGKRARDWKLKYIAAFNAMEAHLRERATIEWQEARRLGKAMRRELTDAIQKLIPYAIGQGCKERSAAHFYENYSWLAGWAAGVEDRDAATGPELMKLGNAEVIISKLIEAGMTCQLGYKEIYQMAKTRLAPYRDLLLLAA